MTQMCPNTEDGQEYTSIRRLKKENVKDSTPSGVPISNHHGPQKPEMPEEVLEKCVLPLKVLIQQRILLQRSNFHDFKFLRGVATKPSTPEFGGFNTKLTRMEGQGLKLRTKAMYTTLIDMTPSDPTTMTSAMLEAKRLTKKESWSSNNFIYCRSSTLLCGSQFTVAYPELFDEDFILRLGGMHFVMSYVGAVEVLMAEGSDG